MSKYSSEFKLKVVEYYLKHNCSYGEVARLYNVERKSLVTWIKKYKEHGLKGLLKQEKLSYSGEFKKYVLEYMQENHLSYRETAIHFNLGSHAVISKWEQLNNEEGLQALYKEKRGRKKNMESKPKRKDLSQKDKDDLIEEVERLRMENAYLKKLQALVQKRTKPKQSKK